MNIVDPIWYLNKVCSRCEQGDSLTYLRCTQCAAFILICEEELIEFIGLDPNELVYGRDLIDSCSNCDAVNTLRDVTSHEMNELGFAKDAYH